MNNIKSGIYKIYSKTTSKYYIGQSVDIESRLNQHKKELRKNMHINKKLQNDFNKYGEDDFIFQAIKYIEEEFLNIMEGYYIELYDSIKSGYNIQDVVQRVRIKERENAEKVKQLDKFKNIESIDIKISKLDLVSLLMYNTSVFVHDYYGYRHYSSDSEELAFKSKPLKSCLDSIYNVDIYNEVNKEMDKVINKIKNQIKRKFPRINLTDFYIENPSECSGNDFCVELTNIMTLISSNELYCCCEYKNMNEKYVSKFLKLNIIDDTLK